VAAATVILGVLSCCYGQGGLQDNESNRQPVALRIIGGDPEAGLRIIAAKECGVCHVIPGVAGAEGIVGPPLTNFAHRQFIGGIMPNRPGTLVQWMRDPPSLAPNTGMPGLGLTEVRGPARVRLSLHAWVTA
jgi:hypothetical protein